jgi:hypothetical protein
MSDKDVRELLVAGPHPFPPKHVDALLRHFENAVDDFRNEEWADCCAKAGKFVEAVVKALGTVANVAVPTGRAFKVDGVVTALRQLPGTAGVDDVIKLVIPRCCTFVYDIASNRGARHDPEEVNPNEMDASVAVANLSWILAEMIRFAQKGAVDLDDAKRLVEALTERKYPVVEKVEGRFYLHMKGKSGVDVAVAALASQHPARIAKVKLVETVKRNGFSDANARMAVSRLAGLVDDNGDGELRLLAPGRQKADAIMKKARS